MAVFAVYIKKEVDYFGEVSPFGNTYHYETDPGQSFDDAAVAASLIAAEREVTQNTVKFIGWTSWGPTDGTALANVIRDGGVTDLQGLAFATAGTYRETAALVVIEIARSAVLNRRRWLRKFIRVPGSTTGSLPTGILQGSTPLSASVAAEFVAYGNKIKNIDMNATTLPLVTEQGDGVPLGTDAQVRPYLYTRQIGR